MDVVSESSDDEPGGGMRTPEWLSDVGKGEARVEFWVEWREGDGVRMSFG